MWPLVSRGLSLARGFIVFIMPAVHTVLIYSNDEVKSGWLGFVLGVLAEQPGAQLFMLQMGLFIGMGRQKTFTAIFTRVVILFAAGYLLNFLRLVLPHWWGGIPQAFLNDNNIPNNKYTVLYLLFMGDILQFAALGYLFCQLVHHYIKSICSQIILLFVLALISPLVWTMQPGSTVLQFTVGLFNGHPPSAFFPFFPWVCYPLAGLVISQVWKKCRGFKISVWLAISFGFSITGVAIASLEPLDWNKSFYRLGPGGTLYHLGAAIGWMALFIFFASNVKPNTVFSFLEWLSGRITSIYFIQWVVIIWMIPAFSYNSLNVAQTLPAMAVTTIISFYLAKVFEKIKVRPA